jgi:hypothetical protein
MDEECALSAIKMGASKQAAKKKVVLDIAFHSLQIGESLIFMLSLGLRMCVRFKFSFLAYIPDTNFEYHHPPQCGLVFITFFFSPVNLRSLATD